MDIVGLVAEGAQAIRDDHDRGPVDPDGAEGPGLRERADELYDEYLPRMTEQLTAFLRRRVLNGVGAIMLVFEASVRNCLRHGRHRATRAAQPAVGRGGGV